MDYKDISFWMTIIFFIIFICTFLGFVFGLNKILKPYEDFVKEQEKFNFVLQKKISETKLEKELDDQIKKNE